MLPPIFEQRVNQFLVPMVEEWMHEVSEEFSRRSNDASARGCLHSGGFIMELTRISIEQIAKRIQVIWEIQKRVLESLGISYSDTLAQELKSQLEAHVPPDCWKLLESYPNVSL